MVLAWASSHKTSGKSCFLKIKAHFQLEKLILNGVPWVPLTFLVKSSSGAHSFFVRHCARSGFAPTEKIPNRFCSTRVDRNAQSMLQDAPSGVAEPCFSTYRNVAKQGFKPRRCSKQIFAACSGVPNERNAQSMLQVGSPNHGYLGSKMA